MSAFTTEKWQWDLCREIEEEIARLRKHAEHPDLQISVEPDMDELFRVYNVDGSAYVDGKVFLENLKTLKDGDGSGWVWFMAGQSS